MHALQMREALKQVRPDMKTCMDSDRELAVLCETIAALQDARRVADAFQAKYHQQLAECEHLHSDLKRAQVFWQLRLAMQFSQEHILAPLYGLFGAMVTVSGVEDKDSCVQVEIAKSKEQLLVMEARLS